MIKRNLTVMKTLYFVRNFRSKRLFQSLKKYCQGDVLDIGGGSFYTTAKNQCQFISWTSLEPSNKYAYQSSDENYHLIIGDGCQMKFKDSTFDTVLCIQVLEHVFEPNKMMAEIARVLKKSGYAIILVPQTANTHLVPNHFYNFTKYWLKRSAKENKLKIVELTPLGGFWSSVASRFFYYFLQSLRYEVFTDCEEKRSFLFYLLLPLAWIWAFINIPISMVFALADLKEEPNNHLAVFRK